MAGLLAPYIPDSGEWFKSAAQGYALGDTMRNRDLSVQAGGQAAEGDLAGAKSTLYAGGNFEGGNQVNQLMRQASDDALKKTEKFHATLGNLAMTADTPDKWGAAIKAAQGAGLDVSKYTDFSARDMVLAQSGKTLEAIGLETDRRKAMQPTYQHTEAGAFDPRTGTLKPYPEGVTTKRTELERRAIAGGLTPGTPEYQDYVLSGPERAAGSEKVPSGYRTASNGNLEFIPGGPHDPASAKPRQFGVADITKLSEEGTKFGSLTGALDTFKPEFSGYMSDAAGQVALAAGRKGFSGKTTQDAASWWQGYDRTRNVVRHELFGSALTPNEQKAFEAADITPGMDPDIVKTNLKTQTGIIKNGLKRKANALIEAGYDPAPIASAYGLDLKDIGVTATGRVKAPANPALAPGVEAKDASQLPAAPGAPTSSGYSGNVDPRALEMLRGNPTPQTMQQFDEIFGQGAAAKALGR